ncbi:TonB-dependent receptor [Niabella sp.]|uniref:TonB-dependent receptor n=1 Tax=Niabella sp. TaxID=1962976 RepID=UPI00260309DF|nr:TonB-dependent receptor [Niabella sp.]
MRRNVKPVILFILAVFMGVLQGYAQDYGNLSGRIIDQNGNTLPGASVTLKGSTLGTSSDLNGFYTLQGIPDGNKNITVEYLGYKPVTISVTILKGKTTTQDIKLTELAKSLGAVVVSATVDGQARALNQQKNADNLMQVVSADQMGRFPDLNVAEALQRLSGVTITRSRGEGSEIQLRGTPANFVNINVNGEQLMGVGGENGARNMSLDVIPSDVLSSMEVQKTLLPSNDGDAIAGVINMRTGIARSLKPKYTMDLGTGYNMLRKHMPYSAKAGFAQRFGASERNKEGVFGIAANASYYNNNNGYDRIEAEAWAQKNIVDKAGAVIDSRKNTWVPTDFRYRYQEGTRQRMGGTLALDYAPNVNTRFVLSGMYNKRVDTDTRYRNRSRYRGNFIQLGGDSLATDRFQNIAQTSNQVVNIDNFNISLDGETKIGTWQIDGGLFYSQSHSSGKNAQYNFSTPDWRANNKDIAGTDNGSGKPIRIPTGTPLAAIPDINSSYLTSVNLYTPAFGGAMNDPERYQFTDALTQINIQNGKNTTGRFNVSKNYFIKNKYASVFSFGAKAKFMDNDRSRPWPTSQLRIATITDRNSPDFGDTRLANFLHKANQSADFLNGNLNFGPSADVKVIEQFIKNRPDRFVSDDYTRDLQRDEQYYAASENVVAGYLMNRIQFNKLMALAGVRFENTSVSYKANRIFRYDKSADPNVNGGQKPGTTPDAYVYDAYTKTPADSSLSYLMVLPNLQFKYDMAKNLILRAAWTTGYSRPNLPKLVPSMTVNTEMRRIELGNPDLKAAYSNNLDFLVEHYMKNVGILSGGFFYKHIDKFQYLSQGTLTDVSNPYYNPDDAFVISQSLNGEAAKVYGVELTLNSSLSFLPGFLKNLFFTGNYTYTNSKAITTKDRGAIRLPGQADHTGNIALSYSSRKLTLQASANYNGKFIYALGADTDQDLWVDSRWQIDLNGSYRITKRLTYYAEVTNINNAPAFTYMGNKNRVNQLEYTDAFIRTGLTFRF